MPPDLRVETLSVASLVPYARNAREHSQEQVAQLAASIREFGFNVPVLVDDAGVLIAGHGRVLAAKAMGLQEVPAIRLQHLTEQQAKAFRLADNKLALNSAWNPDLLRAELADLREMGFDLALTGFMDMELSALFATRSGKTDPDEVPEPPSAPVSRPGDVWILGEHRIACGDSTSPDTVKAVLAGAAPGLMVTDPPYGVNYDPAWRKRAGVASAGVATGVVLNDHRADWREAWALFPGDVAYVWHGGLHAHTVAESLAAVGFELRAQIIWSKPRLVLSRGDYHWRHEPCWYAVRAGAKSSWQGDRKQTTVWEIEHQKSDTGHGTQKPVECMQRPIENSSVPGDAVFEPFSGSGTTIIASEMTGRRCRAIELNPAYVDVAVIRWQRFTGRDAHLEADGRRFAEIQEASREAA